jgi:hypothetical protein
MLFVFSRARTHAHTPSPSLPPVLPPSLPSLFSFVSLFHFQTNPTSPVTRRPLKPSDLVPNRALKEMIAQAMPDLPPLPVSPLLGRAGLTARRGEVRRVACLLTVVRVFRVYAYVLRCGVLCCFCAVLCYAVLCVCVLACAHPSACSLAQPLEPQHRPCPNCGGYHSPAEQSDDYDDEDDDEDDEDDDEDDEDDDDFSYEPLPALGVMHRSVCVLGPTRAVCLCSQVDGFRGGGRSHPSWEHQRVHRLLVIAFLVFGSGRKRLWHVAE